MTYKNQLEGHQFRESSQTSCPAGPYTALPGSKHLRGLHYPLQTTVISTGSSNTCPSSEHKATINCLYPFFFSRLKLYLDGPLHPGHDLPRSPSLRHRDTTDPGCTSSGRREPAHRPQRRSLCQDHFPHIDVDMKVGVFSGRDLGFIVLMACTPAESVRNSCQTTSPGHYAPYD
ncbi:hypothetical protein PHYPO_G00090810 [Pangasianodon hypophthalmus]|uniref:Uncharacterized protein n=1 Tax=Pangasianodon hypophthalmus TaxID=310915 RepID=A0A5N5LAL1_PANHP|nr:hypothetical protein PHYPO_G00090810 [Pangasianodon hypophthalmus]